MKHLRLLFLFVYLTSSLAQAAVYDLPRATEFVALSANRSYPVLRGIEIDPKDPFHLKFIVDTHNQAVDKKQVTTLVRYFLAGLTIPEADLWVNLSPYEQDRVISEELGYTDLGKELLGQDYILKQLTSSLTYPETQIGKNYWKQLYEEVYQLASTTNIPINTYNKVWIVPDKAEIYENKNSAFITEASLTAMHEEDYLALKYNSQEKQEKLHKVASDVMKEVVLPRIAEDVNQGENFAKLRQIYHSLILAAWFKQKLKDSVFRYYLNREKISGIDLEDKLAKEKIYKLYLEAYKKGVYDYIKTDYEPYTNRAIKRKYYSGGLRVAVKPTITRQPPNSDFVSLVGRRTKVFAVHTATAASSVTTVAKFRKEVLGALGKEGATEEGSVNGVPVRSIISDGDTDIDIVRRCIQQHLNDRVRTWDGGGLFETIRGLIITRPVGVTSDDLTGLVGEKSLVVAKIKGKDSGDPRIWLFKAPTAASSGVVTAKQVLENPARVNFKSDKRKFAKANSDRDKTTWGDLIGILERLSARKSQGNPLSNRDRYFCEMLTKKGLPNHSDLSTLRRVQKSLEPYKDRGISLATAEALMRALIIAGVLRWQFMPDIWMFRSEREQVSLEDIYRIRSSAVKRDVFERDNIGILNLDLGFSFPEIDALLDEIFSNDYYHLKNIVAQALWKKEATSGDASSGVTVDQALSNPAQLNLSGDERYVVKNASTWEELFKLDSSASGREGYLFKPLKLIFKSDRGIQAGFDKAESVFKAHLSDDISQATAAALMRALIIAGVVDWQPGLPHIWMFQDKSKRPIFKRMHGKCRISRSAAFITLATSRLRLSPEKAAELYTEIKRLPSAKAIETNTANIIAQALWRKEIASRTGSSGVSAPGGIDMEAIEESLSVAAGNFRFHNLNLETIGKFQTCQGLFIVEVIKTQDQVDLKKELGIK